MTRIYFMTLLSIAVAALAAPTGLVAQTSDPGRIQGGTLEACRARPGGSRIRSNNCGAEAPQTVRTEHAVTVKVELPALLGQQCEASALTEYSQRGATARVTGTVSIGACPAGTTGAFTLVARVRDASGEIKPIEFKETWQRDDADNVNFNGDYPIGDDVELVSVRVRGLDCTCTATAAPEVPAPQAATSEAPR